MIMDGKILSVILGALIGGFISFISFYYKSRIEVRSKVNSTLFHLLEIWSLIGMTKACHSNEFSLKMIERLRSKFPKENIGKDVEKQLQEGIKMALPLVIQSQVDGNDYLEKYTKAVNDLAPIFPLQAYQLNKNTMLMKYLNGIDSLMANEGISESDEDALKSVKYYLNKEAFDEFETDLKALSKKTGFISSRNVIKFIDQVKGRVDDFPDDVFDGYIDAVISPLVQDHYDKQGVKNPNVPDFS